MKDSTRKTILIVAVVLSLCVSLLSLGLSVFLGNIEISEEEMQQVYEVYDGIFSEEELNNALNTGTSMMLKMAILKIVLQVIILITAIKGPNKNRVALIYLSIFDMILGSIFLGLLMLIISCIKSNDIPYEKPTPPELEKVNTFKLPVYIIGFLGVWLLIYNGLLYKIFPGIKEWGEANIMVFEVLFFVTLFLVVLILLRKEIVRDFKAFIHNFSTYNNLVVRGFFWIMILNVVTGLFVHFVAKEQADNQAALNELPLWFMIIFGTIIGPFVEEGIYRGVLGKIIKNRVAFVIISALVFGAMHVVSITSLPESPAQYWFLIQYCGLGVILALNYSKTKNIFSSFMIHMLMNGVATALTACVLI